jgi:hypothetical protein
LILVAGTSIPFVPNEQQRSGRAVEARPEETNARIKTGRVGEGGMSAVPPPLQRQRRLATA